MNDRLTMGKLNDAAVLRVYKQLRWDGSIKAPVDSGTGRPVLERTFATRMQCQLWLGKYHVRLID